MSWSILYIRRTTALVGALILLSAVEGCGRPRRCFENAPAKDSTSGEVGTPTKLVQLGKGVEPLKERFQADRGRHRFVAILSPT